MDIALFDKPFSPKDKKYNPPPQIIIETKKYTNGLAFTKTQIEKYAKKFPSCKMFVTTNGYRYRFYTLEGDKMIPKGYINLLNLRRRDNLDANLAGPFETLLKMSNLIH